MTPSLHRRLTAGGALLLTGVALILPLAALAADSQPTPWREWSGKSYRLEADGNLSCYSTDGVNCYGAPRPATATASADRPLTCGNAHRALYGGTGYDTAGHWCNAAYANLFAAWHNYRLLGWTAQIAFNPAGNAMCQSTNGRDCLWGDDDDTPRHLGAIQPLVCGEAHAAVWGKTGYEQPRHWCNTREIVTQLIRPTLPPWSEPDSRLQDRRDAELTLPSLQWTAADEPAWVARLLLPANTFAWLVAPAETSSGDRGLYSFGIVPRDQLDVWGITGGGNPPWAAPNGPVTMAFSVTADGQVHYHLANGRADDILAASYVLSTDGLRLARARRAGSALGLDAVQLDVATTAGASQPAQVEEVIATRKRRREPL